MANALELSGDIATAATALAGLLLVFMGAQATSFEGYEPQEKKAVRGKFQARTWFAFAGFALALLAAAMALFAKWLSFECAAFAALMSLFLSLFLTLAAALRAALDVK